MPPEPGVRCHLSARPHHEAPARLGRTRALVRGPRRSCAKRRGALPRRVSCSWMLTRRRRQTTPDTSRLRWSKHSIAPAGRTTGATDVASTQSERNDDPAHIAAVAKMAEKRNCDWPGHPCGRDIPEFGGRDAMCLCESLVNAGSSGDVCEGCKHFEDDCICEFLAEHYCPQCRELDCMEDTHGP